MDLLSMQSLFAIRLVLGAALLVCVRAAALLADRLLPVRRARRAAPDRPARAPQRAMPAVVRH